MSSCQRIIIVEDDPMIADVLGDIVSTMGYETAWLSSGEELLSLEEEYSFDLVIMDLELPSMNGLDAANRLARLRPECRVLFMTGYSDAEGRIDHDKPTFRGIIRKPFEISDIRSAIEKAVSC